MLFLCLGGCCFNCQIMVEGIVYSSNTTPDDIGHITKGDPEPLRPEAQTNAPTSKGANRKRHRPSHM